LASTDAKDIGGNDLILLTDNDDVVFADSIATLVSRFMKLKLPKEKIVLSCENIQLVGRFVHHRDRNLCESVLDARHGKTHVATTSGYKYVNAGLIMGYKDAFVKISSWLVKSA
jgi:hypothetical protein